MEEEWRDIKGYEGLYQVSNFGRVKSFPRHGTRSKEEYIMAGGKDYRGYPTVVLRKNNKGKTTKVHRLVAETFIPNPNNLPQVNHKSGLKNENYVSNLEWISASENMKHAYKTGLKKITDKQKKIVSDYCKNYRLIKVNQYSLDGKYIRTWKSIKEAGTTLNISCSKICECCKNKRNKTGNYIWKYSEGNNDKKF